MKDELKDKLREELNDRLNENQQNEQHTEQHGFIESKLTEPPADVQKTPTSSTPTSPVRVVNFVSTNTISRRFSSTEDDDYFNREMIKDSSTSTTPHQSCSERVGVSS